MLFAHEHAHLSGRHHLLSFLVDLCVTVHPAVRGLREPLQFHLERWADEEAAATVGDRKLAAAAVAKAALAEAAQQRRARRGYPQLSVTSGPVPQRSGHRFPRLPQRAHRVRVVRETAPDVRRGPKRSGCRRSCGQAPGVIGSAAALAPERPLAGGRAVCRAYL